MTEPIRISGQHQGGTGYVSTGDTRGKPVEVKFADGVHVVNEAVVAHLGGPEAVQANANMFKGKTYKEFMTGFWKVIEKHQLNQAGAAFISQHMDMRGF